MAQTGYTPISIYYSATATNTPTAGNLVAGELAINTADGKLFYKDSSGVVQTMASKATGTVAGSTTQVIYNNAGAYAGSANFVFDGTNVGIGVTPSTWNTDYKALQIGNYSSFYGRLGTNETGIMNNMYRNGSAQYTYLTSAPAAWYYVSGSSHNWTSSASGTAGNAVTTTQVLSVDRGTTLALQGASSVAGCGVSFPATQVASSDANTLDDYEEGTWTPVLGGSGSTSGQTYSFVSAKYVKVGRNVTCDFLIQFTTIGTITGNLQLKGLPFALSGYVSFGVGYTNAITTASGTFIILNGNDGDSVLTLFATNIVTGTNTALSSAAVSNSTQLGISFSYITSA